MPSPQSIVYLFGFPTVVNVNVAVRGAPPAATSVAASTDFTNVLFLTFSNASFNLSIASDTFSVLDREDMLNRINNIKNNPLIDAFN